MDSFLKNDGDRRAEVAKGAIAQSRQDGPSGQLTTICQVRRTITGVTCFSAAPPMFLAPGFEERSIVTTLGAMAYGAPQPEVWPRPRSTQPLVFIHGFGGGSSSYEWSKVYPAFVGEGRVLAPDLPGWGRSEQPARTYQVADYIGAIAEFLAQTCDEPAIVVASSLSAAMAVQGAIAHPDHIKGLILVAPTGLADFGESSINPWLSQVLRVPLLDNGLYRSAIATAPGIQAFLTTRQFANPDRCFPEIVAAYLAAAQQPNAHHAALAFVRGDLSFDLAALMPRLTVPTAFLWGGAAQLPPIEVGRRLAALNPQAVQRFEVVDGAGLTPQLEQPTQTIRLIFRCLRAITAASSAG